MKNYFYKIYIKTKKYNRLEFNRLIYFLLKYEFSIYFFINYNRFFFKNFCLETGVKRSICNFFSLYRMNLKIKLNSGFINGLKKIS